MEILAFWKTTLEAIEQVWNNARCEKRILTRSAGNRPVYMLAYGKRKTKGTANYSSALGAHDRNCYSAPENGRPTVGLLGATHGQETEGTASLLKLISILETGADLTGKPNDALAELAGRARGRMVHCAAGRTAKKSTRFWGMKGFWTAITTTMA